MGKIRILFSSREEASEALDLTRYVTNNKGTVFQKGLSLVYNGEGKH